MSGKNRSHGAARVQPFVNDLFENAGIRMLGDKTETEHFDALAGNFFDDRGIVQEPPAAEGHKVVEFAGVDAELVLIFAAEHADEKTVGRKIAAKILERAQIRAADGIAGKAQTRIHLFADSDHEREWKV